MDQLVKFVDMKLDFGDTKEHVPTNFGKGGMNDVMNKRHKGKSSTSILTFSTFNVVVHILGV